MILLLAGTYEAREIAELLSRYKMKALASLAGATRAPMALPLPTRIGGFSGVAGLSNFLRREAILAVIDATHPFAVQMSSNAVAACTQTDTPLIRFERPLWTPLVEAKWQDVPDAQTANDLIPAGARVFLTLGDRWDAPFAARTDITCIRRRIEPPASDSFPTGELILARPPYALEAEIALLRSREITHLVAKNSGGTARQKLDAAAQLDIPILMIARPVLPAALTVQMPAEILRWVQELEL